MSQRVAWSLKAVVVSVSLIVVTGLWLWSTLPSTDDARSALSEVLPEHAQIVNERIYRCNTDDGGGPFCGEDYVVLASPTSEQWGAEFVQTAVSHGYRVLADSAGGGREDVDMVRGK